ncbi:MAG: GAF domain-containing protein [Chloroflexi bacterium]|nr:MAG: GAF domain-containing protein [Chloroflexota bacterium]
MTALTQTIHILLIDSERDDTLQTDLQRYGFAVDFWDAACSPVDEVTRIQPDVVVLDSACSQPSAAELLGRFTDANLFVPVALIGANGDAATTFSYPHILGWISREHAASELALLIQTTMAHPLPASELVLIKRADLVDANRRLAERVQELQTLFEIGKSVTSELDLETVLRRVAQAAVDLTAADESYLLLVDPSSGDLYLRAQANIEEEEARNFRVKAKDSISGMVLESGEPVILSRGQGPLKFKTGLSVNSLVNVPVSFGAEVIGVLGVNNRRQTRGFTENDQNLLWALADWAAIAIQNARLYDKTVQFSRNLRVVNEISRLVSGTLDAQQIPRLLLARTAEIVGAECGSLALIDEERQRVVFQLAYDSEGNELKEMTGLVMPPDQGIVGEVAKTGLPVIANEARKHPAWSSVADDLTGFLTNRLIAVPLVANGKIVGVVELLNKDTDFVEEDVQLLTLVASSTAIAIQNARQYQALRQANRAIREAQAQRIASERWAVLGKAAATLAHRINNSTALVPIAAQHTRHLLQEVEMPPELRADIDDNLGRIERNSLYTVEMAEVLLRRFRKNPTAVHDVNALVERAVELVEIPPDINLMLHLDSGLPTVTTSDLLVDVFVELMSNAVRAMAGRPGSFLRVATFSVGDNRVSIQITDNGPGIPAENQQKIFDMFFTTTKNGLGFGLWWVKTFLEQQNGEITVESVPGRGTTFTVVLPCDPPSLRSSLK